VIVPSTAACRRRPGRRGEGEVGGAQQPLAVQVSFPGDGGPVDARQAGFGAAQEPAQPGLGAQLPHQFVAAARTPAVRPVDVAGQVADQPFPDGGVARAAASVV
jgi:hypothetical protein